YETNKLVRINSVRLGSLKWTVNVVILMFICIMMLWNKNYQEFDPVVSSTTTKVKGVALTRLPGLGDVVWDVVDYSGVQTGTCVKFDTRRKTCEVSAWCPVETRSKPPRPALLAAAENFTVLIKNNIRFPAFNYVK
ncbi:hypothetical protein CRUP_008532, partial [Coryphaenoides rupestris]